MPRTMSFSSWNHQEADHPGIYKKTAPEQRKCLAFGASRVQTHTNFAYIQIRSSRYHHVGSRKPWGNARHEGYGYEEDFELYPEEEGYEASTSYGNRTLFGGNTGNTANQNLPSDSTSTAYVDSSRGFNPNDLQSSPLTFDPSSLSNTQEASTSSSNAESRPVCYNHDIAPDDHVSEAVRIECDQELCNKMLFAENLEEFLSWHWGERHFVMKDLGVRNYLTITHISMSI